MPSLREIRGKIKAVGAQGRIFKAMKMIAAARMRRSQTAILSARPYASKMDELVRRLALLEAASDIEAGREIQIHPYFDKRPQGPLGLVFVTADKGLCGAFNTNLIREALRFLRANQGRKILVAAAGKKGRDFLHRLQGFDLEVMTELSGIFPRVGFAHAELLGKAVLEAYEKRGVQEVTLIYNEFKSVAVQRVVRTTLLPIPPVEGDPAQAKRNDYSFEPGRQELLADLLPRFVKSQLYRSLLESQAAELAARMSAMDAASKNARELRDSLNLDMNRRRQAMITSEIAELVGGAEALAT